MADPTLKGRLAAMAREAEDPSDRDWAKSMYREEFGEDLDSPAQRFDMRTSSVPSFDPMDAAIKRRAAQQESQKMGAAEAFAHGAGQGALGLGDEIGASGRAFGFNPAGVSGGAGLFTMGAAALRNREAGDPTGMKTYREGVSEARAGAAQAAEDQPLAYYPGMIGMSLALPGPKVGGSGFVGNVLKAGAKGSAEGAAYGVGQSEADDVGGVLKDALPGAGLGAGLGIAGQAVGEGVKAVGGAVAKNLKKRVVNEFAEGLESKTTPTQQKHLNRAQEDIYREVSTGPDAKAVRGTVYKGAAEGREILKPIVDEVGQANKESYAAFTKAGRGKVDIAGYMQRLAARADEADQAGDVELFEAINSHIDEVDKAYQRTGDMALTRLRGMTTKVQKHAASAVGGLNTHAAAELEGRLMATATEAMDDTLGIAARGVPELESAAQSIRSNNRRIYALKTVDKGLQLREHKEAAGPGALVRIANAAGTPGAAAGAGYVLSEDEDKVQNAAMAGMIGLGAKGLVPLAKLGQRKITDMGIATQLPGYSGPTAGTVGNAIRPFVPPLGLNIMDAYMRRRQQEQGPNGRR